MSSYGSYQGNPHSRRARSVHRDRHCDGDCVRDRGSELRPRARTHSSSSGSPGPGERLKNVGEQALVALGLGGAAGALAGHHSRGRDRSSHRGHRRRLSSRRSDSSSPSPSLSGGHVDPKVKQALEAAVAAGAVEAFLDRHEPGGWSGPKGERVLTAALTAAGVDGVIDRDPDKHPKRHIIESTLAGLAANRVIHGHRSSSR